MRQPQRSNILRDGGADTAGISSAGKEEAASLSHCCCQCTVCCLYRVVLTSSTGRQRKPLEVLGVYDPIPRHPTKPTGEILENETKIKKISMNINRMKYWLSVGAQPTDPCRRILAKVYLQSINR